jgi:hypothetical protein
MIAETDTDHLRGARSCFSGNMHLLEDFEYNKDRPLSTALRADYSTHIDPATGAMRMDIPSFVPGLALQPPSGAKYFQLFIKGAAVSQDYQIGKLINGQDFNNAQTVSQLIPIDALESGDISLELQVPVKPGELLLLGVGILFYEELYGVPLAIRGGALTIARVDKVPKAETSGPRGYARGRDAALASAMAVLNRQSAGSGDLGRLLPAGNSVGSSPLPDYNEKLRHACRQLWLLRLDKYRQG